MSWDKFSDVQIKRLLERINLAKVQEVHLVVGRRCGTGKSLFLKKLYNEHGYLRSTIFWISEFDGVGNEIDTFVGTLGELINSKYNPNSRYTLMNYKHLAIAENMTVLELILKMKELSKIL